MAKFKCWCGANADSPLGCWKHKPKKPLKRGRIKQKIPSNIEEKEQRSRILYELFQEIWKERQHLSEVSGKDLRTEALTWMFHHILPKSKYPEAAFDKDNIILLTWEEHQLVEGDPYRYEEINKRREQLKQKYEI